jgi:hypothetical protein
VAGHKRHGSRFQGRGVGRKLLAYIPEFELGMHPVVSRLPSAGAGSVGSVESTLALAQPPPPTSYAVQPRSWQRALLASQAVKRHLALGWVYGVDSAYLRMPLSC